ncbi:MAG: beta-N-acetylhexosaminidase [Ruminococcaceae bacterium]|nr:beta-N-acetylhexosaminidase [Oscillospiraceae bacterium]
MGILYNDIPEELNYGIQQMEKSVCVDREINITASKSAHNKIMFDGIKCDIEYADKVYFFRALSILLENINKGQFDILETKKTKSTGVLLDLSRNAALTVASLKKYMDFMAKMGMNRLYLYMEDMFEVSERCHFGYLRGRYTKEELKEIDDYGFNYGIEVIPSIQALGHHYQYLRSEESYDVKDTSGELLVGEKETYIFIENMIKSVLSSLRTKRIVINMDETHTLGLGNYLKKNGYENPQQIFLKHLKKVYEITDRLGLEAIISSDMFFNMASKKHYYYDKQAIITKETIEKIPENATLIYWHYGEEYGCDDYMFKKHMEIGRKIIFYGGTWTWSGHLPETVFALDCTKKALESCERHNVEDVVMTVWGDNGNECNHFYALLTLCYAAEFTYGNEEKYRERFEALTGIKPEAFEDMSAYQNAYSKAVKCEDFTKRFYGKTLFYQDILLGQADLYLKEHPMSGHYRKYAEKFKLYSETGSAWKSHFEYIFNIFKILEIKCYVAQNLQDAYRNKDKNELEKISRLLTNELYKYLDKCHKKHKELWFLYNKPFGWEVLDIRYAGLMARTVTAYERINAYLCGKIERIEELEEERLPYTFSPFTKYPSIATNTYEF